MILEFKTARNANGHRKYLMIDTDKKTYSRECSRMIITGLEIKARDYKNLLNQVIDDKYMEV